MTNLQKIQIERAIIELERPYPKDDLIMSYADFLRVRPYLGYYQFNPVVFERLLDLVIELWTSTKRINRFSLLQKTKQYLHTASNDRVSRRFTAYPPLTVTLSIDTRKKLFTLFMNAFEKSNFIRASQLEEIQRMCNNLVMGLAFTAEEETWLCTNVSKSEMILNRILRYPAKSKIIYNWAKANYKNDFYRGRRAELLSWILDEEPNYEVDIQTLTEDFEYLNKTDRKAIQDYNDEMKAIEIMERDLGEFLPKITLHDFLTDADEEVNDITYPSLNFVRRPYFVPTEWVDRFQTQLPDFKALSETFYSNIQIHQKFTMIWAICYSRIDNATKSTLLKKYFCERTFQSIFKICERNNNIKFLKWMLKHA